MKREPYSSKNLWRVLTYGDGIIVMKGTFEEMEQLYKMEEFIVR